MANVRLENIIKSFDGKANVVNGININIEKGEFVVIVGASGCGKTTTLNIIAGLETVTKGSVFIDDKDVTAVEPKDRNIAMVFQSHTLYPHLNVYKNLAFALKIKRIKKHEIENRISNISKMLGIEDLLKRKPHQLSGGQKQRVAIGRAIIREPLVFLMDEPLSNLDANLKGVMREELKRLHNNLQATFIYVTHDQIEAMTLATKLIVMNEGEVQQIGTPYDVFMNPSNLFVAKFMGVHKINLFHCKILKKEGEKFVIDFFGLTLYAKLDVENIEKIYMGIRPEGFVISMDDIGVKLDNISTEILGFDTLFKGEIVSEFDKFPARVLLPTKIAKEISKEMLVMPVLDMIMFFNTETSQRIIPLEKITFTPVCSVGMKE